MGIFDGYLIASDFDGTFADYNQCIPQSNIDAVDYFIENGGDFTLATGRSLPSVRNKLPHLSHNAPTILCNGAIVYDFEKEEVLWASEMPKSAMRLTAEIKKAFPDVGIELMKGRDIYLVNATADTARHIGRELLTPIECDISEVPGGCQKMMFLSPHERLLEVEQFVKSKPQYNFDFIFTEPHYYEGLDAKISKAVGLAHLSKLLKTPKSHIVAVGDYLNDIEMLKYAGISACPAGAPDEVKAVSDWVLADVSEGIILEVVKRLEKLIK